MRRVDREYVLRVLREAPTYMRADLKNLDMSCLNFCGVDFRNADLSGSDFSFAQLVGANLVGVEANAVSLVGADCTGACFDFSRWTDTIAEDVITEGASFVGAWIGKSDTTYVKFPDNEEAREVYNTFAMGMCPFQWAKEQL